jgi:hypothetical protein
MDYSTLAKQYGTVKIHPFGEVVSLSPKQWMADWKASLEKSGCVIIEQKFVYPPRIFVRMAVRKEEALVQPPLQPSLPSGKEKVPDPLRVTQKTFDEAAFVLAWNDPKSTALELCDKFNVDLKELREIACRLRYNGVVLRDRRKKDSIPEEKPPATPKEEPKVKPEEKPTDLPTAIPVVLPERANSVITDLVGSFGKTPGEVISHITIDWLYNHQAFKTGGD